MSRIGKKPIAIPSGVTVTVSGHSLSVKGSQGTVAREFKPAIAFEVVQDILRLTPRKKDRNSIALWGTYASHAANMIKGVGTLFQKKLIVEGIGFKAEVKGDELLMNLGFSHQVKVKIPKGISVKAEKGLITISGVDIESVGQFAAMVRHLKKPEPYKGKGIRYDNEVVRRKQGKKTA
ncbi:MAG: 50S ribosomal protein L6 [Candidatus Taylorbacteria bacterium]|nr:50S ribosomal protein L6 [Candidatus Taylorbacteria bacterium]